MKNKTIAIIYALALGASIFNAYHNYKIGNFEAAFAWFCASGMAGGAAGAYMKLIEIDNEDEDNIS